jgi:hypothetical protein
MKQHYTLQSGIHTFELFLSSDPKHIDQAGRPFITAKLYREDQQEHTWDWQGYLLPEMNVTFQLLFKDHVDIRGHLMLKQQDGSDRSMVMVDARFGRNLVEHFEGIVFKI